MHTMRDPELMQRADRAAITLEQAWESWRGMHGLGNEPLPPVSSYVGYSLEEPWGQPRVVFGLRADEAELLASLLEGHDCAGPIYPDVRPRPDWRRPVAAAVPELARPYSNPVSVPAQGHAPAADLADPEVHPGLGLAEAIAADDPAQAGSFADGVALGDAEAAVTLTPDSSRGKSTDRASRSRKPRAGKASQAGEPAEASQSGQADAGSADEGDGPDGAPEASPLMPLPDIPDSRTGEVGADSDETESGPRPRPGRPVRVPAQGPGYRGPRYQGFPPRYDSSVDARAAAANAPDDDDGVDEPLPAPARRPHVTKLSRNPRRRAGNG
jgi:hypothetical protein